MRPFPLILAAAIILIAWWSANRWWLRLVPEDPGEGGRLQVLSWGTDPVPMRQEQVRLFNRTRRDQGLALRIDPGRESQDLITRSAAGNAPDLIDVYWIEEFRAYVHKGLVRPLNPWLKAAQLDPARLTWPARLGDLSDPNPAWREGEDPIDRRIWLAVPNNLDYPVVLLNRSLLARASEEARAAGREVPHSPWPAWTWWDYAALAACMHRRGPDGRFLSFGASAPDIEQVAMQASAGLRGQPQPPWREGTGGTWEAWPDREALHEALRLAYDLRHAIRGTPTASDSQQMTAAGGAGSWGMNGGFLAGQVGMLITGRWFLGILRPQADFDWQLLRPPRWVPYAEWARWRSAGQGPGRRDGPWGDREDGRRGSCALIRGKVTFISSSCRDPDRAFAFLRFLLTDPDYNRLLLLEDGAGADWRLAQDYLGHPDPLTPGEDGRRLPEHELGALVNQHPGPVWPFPNHELAKQTIYWGNLGNALDRPPADPGTERYDWLEPFGDGRPMLGSATAVAAIGAKYLAETAEALEQGRRLLDPPGAEAPSWRSWLLLGVLGAAGVWLLRRRGA